VELLADIDHVRNQVADDFWRTHIYSLAPLPCTLLTNCFGSPDKLLASITGVLGGNGRVEPEVGSVEEVLLDLEKAMEGLRLWWTEHSTKLCHRFTSCLPESCFKK